MLQARGRRGGRFRWMKHSLIWIAILLVIVWVVARLVLAVTAVALNLLWVIAIVVAVVWVIGHFRNRA